MPDRHGRYRRRGAREVTRCPAAASPSPGCSRGTARSCRVLGASPIAQPELLVCSRSRGYAMALYGRRSTPRPTGCACGCPCGFSENSRTRSEDAETQSLADSSVSSSSPSAWPSSPELPVTGLSFIWGRMMRVAVMRPPPSGAARASRCSWTRHRGHGPEAGRCRQSVIRQLGGDLVADHASRHSVPTMDWARSRGRVAV